MNKEEQKNNYTDREIRNTLLVFVGLYFLGELLIVASIATISYYATK